MRQADTDVHSQPRENPNQRTRDARTDHARRGKPQAGRAQVRIGERLGEWQRTELRIARGFAECRGLTSEQLEDVYQETALALLTRPYATDEHLRNALRHGIKRRALNVHRDTRRRTQILAEHAPSMQRVAESRESHAGPEEAALAEQDRLIVNEFLSELDELERQIFWLEADGMRYRAIARTLEIPVNEARNASRSCERKRERFQLLYDTGRLCGYRAATIQALERGELTDVEIARRAFAHLEACVSCRAEHKRNAARLRAPLHERLPALLPLSTILERAGRVRQLALRTAGHAAAGMRERTTALIGAGGVGAKVTTGVATVAVIAAGTVAVTRHVEHHPDLAARHTAQRPGTTSETETVAKAAPAPARHAGIGHRAATQARRWTRVTVNASGRAASRSLGAQPASAAREFGPEDTRGAPSATEAASPETAASQGAAAEREFGLAAGG
jgi:RNA polymerase sigma factor (sigma-70 family)